MGTDFFDPSVDRPFAPLNPSVDDVTFDNLKYWQVENRSGWLTRAVDIDVVDEYASRGLALKMKFVDVGLDEYDYNSGTGTKSEASYSFLPPQERPLDFSGRTRISFELTYLSDDPVELQLGITTGDDWAWHDAPGSAMPIRSLTQRRVQIDIPTWLNNPKAVHRVTFKLDRKGEPVSGAILVADIAVE
jgi:hypothetical protein